ncbi:MAG: hypothetical protein DRH34_05480 [Deltaproteobacteria bacterium]|nr:MAG: hypothetical protein DRH34_05480 [Deltaproteobacteria bacterium]RLC14030.1 MAG: hypothetical protein DRH93_21240 [Deltaproteobacteria bacterium]
MFKKTGISFIILFIGIVFICEASFAARPSDVLTGVTTGKRRIINHNIQQAKQKAVSDALKVALQNSFATLVSRQVFASRLDFFYDQVLSHTSDYIITYRVLGGIENKGHYLVGVESKVDVALLEKTLTDARILNANMDKPVILFFIVEKTPQDLLPKYWWGKNPIPYQSFAEEIIINKMVQDRFIITGNGLERPDPSFYNITFNSIYDTIAAKDLGVEMKADMIVFGKASASEAINRMGEEKTFNAQINLEGYNLETGEKVVTSQVQAVAVSDTDRQGNIQAIIKAAVLSAQDLSEKIDTYWTQNLRKEHAFDTRIEGENFLPRFIALKQRFKQMSGIENMQPKEMGSNYAILQIFYKGKPSQFADAVMLKTFESFGLEISDVTEEFVLIKFIEKQEEAALFDDSKDTAAPVEEIQNTTE